MDERILGIDPGSSRIGYGLIEGRGDNWRLLTFGVWELAERNASEKLASLAAYLSAFLKEYTPSRAGLEKLYFSKNRKTALGVAHARGVIALILQTHGVPTIELEPSEIKLAVTGYGRADKRAVARMVERLLGARGGRYDDATDALATALAASGKARSVMHSFIHKAH